MQDEHAQRERLVELDDLWIVGRERADATNGELLNARHGSCFLAGVARSRSLPTTAVVRRFFGPSPLAVGRLDAWRAVHERCGRKEGERKRGARLKETSVGGASRPTESNATKAAVLRCTARQALQLAAVLGWLVLISATIGLVWRESMRRCVVAIVALTFVTRTSCHAATASAQGAFAPSQGASARRARCPSLRMI